MIGGPTASGKSGLALDLAERLGGSVINADSLQVYRELRLLTARPSVEDEARVPHHLYGHRSGEAPSSMANWWTEARQAITAARSNGQVPVVVGGTGLYLRALADGFSDIPDVPPDIRAAMADRRDRLGAEAFFEWLCQVDPVSARTLTAGDTQRVLRAAEVLEATGRPIDAWRGAEGGPSGLEAFSRITLVPPREPLYQRCDTRFLAMLEQGALEEARAFMALGYPLHLPVNKALGLGALRHHLNGDLSLDDAIAAAQQSTRNYAKRQLTWFRNQVKPDPSKPAQRDLSLDAQYSETFLAKIVSFVQKER
ncbi:MAG: tRNA (adenosine(37)-N6)-dimethylallyltransferase MiaA [Pseudomonadota bacterium]